MFNYSIYDLFTPVRSKLNDHLVSPEQLKSLDEFMQEIPGGCSSFFGFECDLRSPGALDFLFCATQREKHSSVLAGTSHLSLPDAWFNDKCWQKVRDFSREWEDENSSIFQQLENVWLEFDTSSTSYPFSPNLFFGMREEFWAKKAKMGGLVGDCIDLIDPRILSDKVVDNIIALINWLPESAGIFQVGVMLARPTNQVRICLRGLSISQARNLISDLNFPIDPAAFQKKLSPFAVISESIALSIDIGEEFGPKVGLECSFGHDHLSLARLQDFLALLEAKKMCPKTLTPHLLNFHGTIHQDLAPEKWSQALIDIARITGPDTINLLPHWIHHIKLVQDGDAPLYAKAYLAIEHCRARRTEIANALKAST